MKLSQKIVRYCNRKFKAFCCLSDEEIKDDIFGLKIFHTPFEGPPHAFRHDPSEDVLSYTGDGKHHLFALVNYQDCLMWIPVIIKHPEPQQQTEIK